MNCKMNGFNVEEDKEATDKRKNGSSLLHPHFHIQHRRSKRCIIYLFIYFIIVLVAGGGFYCKSWNL